MRKYCMNQEVNGNPLNFTFTIEGNIVHVVGVNHIDGEIDWDCTYGIEQARDLWRTLAKGPYMSEAYRNANPHLINH